MRFFNFLFSRTFIVALLLLLQILFVAVLFLIQALGVAALEMWFLDDTILFQTLFTAISIGLVLFIVERKETPEFKLPWLFLLLIIPTFGLLLYLLFARPFFSRHKKQVKSIREEREETAKRLAPSPEEAEAVAAFPAVPLGVEQYLQKTAVSFGTLGNRVRYFPLGEDFFGDLCQALKGAEHFIFMEYFIIERGKMWNTIREILVERAKAGVRVVVMYDDIGSSGKLPLSTRRKLGKLGIECHRINPFRPILSAVYNNRDHRKITVIDGLVGYTGGVNLGDEYINETHPFGHWKDTAVRIEGPAVRNLTALFLETYEQVTLKKTDKSPYLDVLPPTYEDGGWVHPFGTGPRPLYGERVGESVILQLIGRAKKSLRITTPYLIPDYNLTSALRDAALRGVKVEIITPHVPDKRIIFSITRANYRPLLEAGVHIYEYTPGFVHAKVLLCDEEVALVGTLNLDYRSLVHHSECGALFTGCSAVRDVEADFAQTLRVSQEIPADFKPAPMAKLTNLILAPFTPLF